MNLRIKELEGDHWLVSEVINDKPVDIGIFREVKDMEEYNRAECKKLSFASSKFLILDEAASFSLGYASERRHLSLSLIKRKFAKSYTPNCVFNDRPYITVTHMFRSVELMNEWIDKIPERCTLLVYSIYETDDAVFLRCNVYDPESPTKLFNMWSVAKH